MSPAALASRWWPWAAGRDGLRSAFKRRPPLVTQMQRTDCGAACLAMVLAQHGHAAPLAQVRAACGQGRDGASAAALAAAAAHYAMTTQAFRVAASGLHELALPAVLFVDGDHFVVLHRRCRDGWQVLDPAGGRVRWTDEQMAARLSGVALVFTPAPGFSRRRPEHPGLQRYLAQLRRSGAAIAVIGLATLLLEVVALLAPAALQVMVDQVIQPARHDWLWPVAAAAAIGAAGQALLLFLRDRVIHRLNVVLDLSLMSGFVLHLLCLPLGEFLQRPVGDLMQRVQGNLMLREVATRFITAACDAALVLGYAALLMVYHPLLGGGVVLSHLARLALTQLGGGGRSDAAALEQAAAGRERSAAAEALAAPEFVQAWQLAEPLAQRQRARLQERVEASLQRLRLAQRSARGLQAFDALAFAALLGGCGAAVASGSLSAGAFAAFIAVAALLGRPLQSLAALAGGLSQLRGSLARLDDVLALPRDEAGGAMPAPVRGAIELRGLRLRFGRHGPWVLDGIDLHVAAGEKVAIVGASGAGKSTLVSLILGLQPPSAGEVLLDGRDLAVLDRTAVRRHFASVLQDPFLFDASARSNLWLGDDPPPDDTLRQAALGAHLHAVLLALPKGYDTPLGPGARRLSSGQRQRLALARALARRPAVLVLDEATSHLDAVTETQVQAHLASLGCTQIIVAHRLATVRHADRICVLQHGRIVQSGRFDELAAADGPFRDLFQAGEAAC